MRLFLCGDVMTGRGIDRILPHPGDPALAEARMTSAEDYVRLAERACGPIPRGAPPGWIWGDALEEIARRAPDLRIGNLETAITDRGAPEPKGVNYRMHPANAPCLTALGLDAVALANNHVGDWGPEGLRDTCAALDAAGIAHAGAGEGAEAAARPAVLETPAGRLRLFSYAFPSSGTPPEWRAERGRAGVNLLDAPNGAALRRILRDLGEGRAAGDIDVVSLHWGPNWSPEVPPGHRRFARALVHAGAHAVHGHSSHHPMGIDVAAGRAILYGCGDFLNDYEGIAGREAFRPELVLGYVLELAPDGRLTRLEALPFRIRRFRLARAAEEEAAWLRARLDRDGAPLGTRAHPAEGGGIRLGW